MESERDAGREEERLEEGLIEWIRVLREGLDDFRVRFVAKDKNSCGEELSDERSFFSIVISDSRFQTVTPTCKILKFMDNVALRGKYSIFKFLFISQTR